LLCTYLHCTTTLANDKDVTVGALVQVTIHESLHPQSMVVMALSLNQTSSSSTTQITLS
jgi:hypothetical protein